MGNRYLGIYSIASRRRRSFHRVGIGLAGAIMAVGLALIGAAVIRLDLLERLGADTLRSSQDLRSFWSVRPLSRLTVWSAQ
jgi:hypothetical protein